VRDTKFFRNFHTYATVLHYCACIGKSRNLGCVSVQSLWKLSNRAQIDTEVTLSLFLTEYWTHLNKDRIISMSICVSAGFPYVFYARSHRISLAWLPTSITRKENNTQWKFYQPITQMTQRLLNEINHLSLFVLINIIYWSTVLTLSECWLTEMLDWHVLLESRVEGMRTQEKNIHVCNSRDIGLI